LQNYSRELSPINDKESEFDMVIKNIVDTVNTNHNTARGSLEDELAIDDDVDENI
jgi:hypothetical protein